MSEEYDLFIIESEMNINRIFTFLNEHSDVDNSIIVIVKDFYRDPNTKEYFENGLKLAILHISLFKNLRKIKTGFKISKYVIRPDQYHNVKNSAPHFYYPCDDKRNNDVVMRKMKCFSDFGLIDKESWFIHEQYGVCEFSSSISRKKRIMIKLILDSPRDFRVSWCRLKLFNKIQRVFED